MRRSFGHETLHAIKCEFGWDALGFRAPLVCPPCKPCPRCTQGSVHLRTESAAPTHGSLHCGNTFSFVCAWNRWIPAPNLVFLITERVLRAGRQRELHSLPPSQRPGKPALLAIWEDFQ